MFGKPDIDVTIVATLRPEILSRTLDSLSWMVRTQKYKLRAVVNIDMAGGIVSPGMILSEVEKVLPIKTYRVSDSPSFAKAVKWVWANSTSKYVLHLEDDWEFVREICLDWCVDRIEKGKADYIRFSKFKKEVIEDRTKIDLLPSFWIGDTVRALSCFMIDSMDPEKQLRVGRVSEDIDRCLPVKIENYPGGLCVNDIGRKWREEYGIEKWKPGENPVWKNG